MQLEVGSAHWLGLLEQFSSCPFQVGSWAMDFGRRPSVHGPQSWRKPREACFTEQLKPTMKSDYVFQDISQLRYYQIKTREGDGDVPMTTLRTRQDHYEFVVSSFVLTNAPMVFMELMIQVFKGFLDTCVIVFIHDILVSSKTDQEHKVYLLKVLDLGRNKLFVKFCKCEFWLCYDPFLGHVV